MAFAGKKRAYRAVLTAGALSLVVLALPQPASAGFFDRLFGGFRRAIEAPAAAVSEPLSSLTDHLNANENTRVRAASSGPARSPSNW